MSLSSENMMKLMAYADGELEGDQAKEAEKLLATDPESLRFVENIAGLGNIVAMGHGARSGKAIAKFDIADEVMDAVKADTLGVKTEPARVVSMSAAREKRANAEAGKSVQKKSGNGASSPLIRVAGGIAAALALAASVFVFTQNRNDETPMAKAPVATPALQSPDLSAETVGAGVDVHTVNSPGNSVSVFYLPNTANEMASSLVVWVDETGEK